MRGEALKVEGGMVEGGMVVGHVWCDSLYYNQPSYTHMQSTTRVH